MKKLPLEENGGQDMDYIRTTVDEAVSQHAKVLDEKFAKMVSSITKTFYEKITQVAQISGCFEMLTKMQFKEWNQWRVKFATDMNELKGHLSKPDIYIESNKEGTDISAGKLEKSLNDKLALNSIVLDEKFTKAILCATKDFEEKLVQVTNIIKGFETQTQKQIIELNQWRLKFENELHEMKQHLSIPCDGTTTIDDIETNATEIILAKPNSKDPSSCANRTSKHGCEMANKYLVAVLDDLREKVCEIQSKVNVHCENSDLKVKDAKTEKKSRNSDNIHADVDGSSVDDVNPSTDCIDSKKPPSTITNTFLASDYGVKKFCGHLDDIEKLILDENGIDFLRYALVRVGTNDMENKEVNQVFDEINNIISLIREKYKDVVIILDEVMSKNTDRDEDVKTCNDLINSHYQNTGNVFIRKVTSL